MNPGRSRSDRQPAPRKPARPEEIDDFGGIDVTDMVDPLGFKTLDEVRQRYVADRSDGVGSHRVSTATAVSGWG